MGIQMLFRALICVSKVLLFCEFSLGRVPGERASELVILNPFVRYFQCLERKKKKKSKPEIASNMYIRCMLSISISSTLPHISKSFQVIGIDIFKDSKLQILLSLLA